MSEPRRILQIVTVMERAGLESMLMNYYRHIDRTRVQFDFLVHRDAPGAFEAEILALGGRIFRLPPLSARTLGAYRRASDAFFAEHPEYRAVHAHLDAMSALPLMAAKRAGVPVRIAHSHVTAFDRDAKLPFRLLAKTLIPACATDTMACSQAAGRFMFGRHFSGRVLKNAIEAERFRFDEEARSRLRAALGLGAAFVVGQVGRFHPQKNHALLLDAFAVLLQKRPDAQLLLVGDGAMRAQIEARAARADLRGHVRLLGVRADTAALLQAMDAFALPSLSEGLGMAAIEAQAAGLPCLLSDAIPAEAGAVASLVRRLPVAAGPAAWAAALSELSGAPRPDTLAQMRAAGYDVSTAADALCAYYLHGTEGV